MQRQGFAYTVFMFDQALQEAYTRCIEVITSITEPHEVPVQVSCEITEQWYYATTMNFWASNEAER